MAKHREYYKGEGGLPPSSNRGEFYESVSTCDSSVHQKCSNYELINLLFDLCRSVRIIDLLFTRSNPHLGPLARLSTPEVLQNRECTLIPYPFVVSTFGFTIESIKEFGGAS